MNRSTLELRARLLRRIRTFFDDRGYLEAEVPILSPKLIPEAHIPPFRTQLEPPDWDQSAPSRSLYLLPSPELYLKRLLADGSPSLYCITKCFRNRESFSPRHSPEFSMLEVYTREADYLDSLNLTGELLAFVADGFGDSARDLGQPIRRMTMVEAFSEIAGLDLMPSVSPAPGTSGDSEALSAIRDLCGQAGLSIGSDIGAAGAAGRSSRTPGEPGANSGGAIVGGASSIGAQILGSSEVSETWDDLFQRLFLTFVEPGLPDNVPLALIDYPWRVRTTAKRRPGSPWSERWELYYRGLELANVYTEENDPALVREYLDAEAEALRGSGADLVLDEGFVEVARRLPRCSGGALGLDRLAMAVSGHSDIRQVLHFPLDGNWE